VAAAAREAPATGETIYVISAQSTFGWGGLSAAVARLGEVDTLVIASSRFTGTDATAPSGAVVRRVMRAPFKPIPALRLGTTIALTVRSSFGGTLAESVRAADMVEYATAVARAAGIPEAASAALPVPPLPGAWQRPAAVTPRDSLAPAAALLSSLTDTYGVSGHEGAVRAAVRAALPTWAQSRARVDTAGNLILALGPDRDTVVFMAHLDEIGFEVTSIARDGRVSLKRLGGFFPFLWEGQPAFLHIEQGDARTMLPGIFVPRDSASTREPRELTAWFGLDSAALIARGAVVGSTLTGYKSATRLAASRFTNRSIDDRAGCTALLLALRAIDPAKLTHKVIFVWSVREETGLDGAAAMANTLGAPIRRVHAVDTFVSSDSPLESKRFAYAPIGKGAVVRALDNSSATPPSEVDSVVALARRAGIPLQVGTTNGGNDGSEFVRYGTPDVPIAWPLRYSHSPAEVIDLADVAALGRLVAALAMQ
jgi:putative aminopeptidase FrvX